eukprot:389878_1
MIHMMNINHQYLYLVKQEDKQTITFGVTTTFRNQESLFEFADIINKEFKELKHFLSIGRDIIVPAPTENDLQNNHIYWHNNKQIIFHNIGTGIDELGTEYLQYIQLQINLLQQYGNYEKEEKYEYEKHILEMETV